MRLLVASLADPASVTIREELRALVPWRDGGTYGDRPVLRRDDDVLLTIEGLHLHEDAVDRLAETLGLGAPDLVVFLSKHRAESGRDSLTVHPIGNFGAAAYGGREETLVPAAPRPMTETLRRIRKGARGMGYAVTYEATHHGPFLTTPAYFVEVGSGEAAWRDADAARVLATALLDPAPSEDPIAVGVGGGHYVPRLTDLAVDGRIAFGHLVPSYALRPFRPEVLDRAVEATPEATLAYVHRKGVPKAILRTVEGRLTDLGLDVVRGADLAPRRPQDEAPQSL